MDIDVGNEFEEDLDLDLDLDLANNPNQLNSNFSNVNDDSINYILCPMCQTPIKPNAANLCIRCLNSQIDISEGISKQLVLFQCRQCERYFKNPQWIDAELESPQLLAVCLKKIRGLSKVKLIDAAWIWTEPHSHRLRIKLTIEKEVYSNAIIQKSFEVEYVMENQQCDVCQASFTHHQWRGCVQLRQKATHKRTFLFLEQLILKHNMTSNCLGIREQKDGLDFFFYNKSNAVTFLNFLHGMVPIDANNNKNKNSKRLVSADLKSNTQKFKYSFMAEISNICKGDLAVMPIKLLKKCGGRSPMMICYKVTNSLHFIDPISLHTVELDSSQFFRHRFTAIASKKHVSIFFVMNVRHMKVRHGKHQLMEVELMRETDMENANPPILDSMTHLGGIIKEGDYVCGYDLQLLASVNEDIDRNVGFQKYIKKHRMLDVIIVSKHYPKRVHHSKRKWKLKSLVKDRDYADDKATQAKEMVDKEEFMRELEEDFDMRCRINIFKNTNDAGSTLTAPATAGGTGVDVENNNKNNNNNTSNFDESKSVVSEMTDMDDEDVPKIPFEELMDDLNAMKLDVSDQDVNNKSMNNASSNNKNGQMQSASNSNQMDDADEDDDMVIAD